MMNKKYASLASVFFASIAIQGCSVGKPYSEINPRDAELQMRKSNGYYSLKTVTKGKTKLVLRSEGMPYPVSFSTCMIEMGSDSAAVCKDFEKVGSVADGGGEVLLPWVAKMTSLASRQKGFIALEMAPLRTVHVKGEGSWYSAPPFRTHGRCGPLTSTFAPLPDHVYLIQFLWVGNKCKQVISDATNPDDVKPIALRDAHAGVTHKPGQV